MYYNAINTGEVTIIRSNKIIGSGKVSCVKGNEFAVIRINDDLSKELVVDDLLCGLDRKYLPFHFCPITGAFIAIFENDETFDEVNNSMEDVYAVDTFNLRWGMVPDFFRNCEGYNSFEKEQQ